MTPSTISRVVAEAMAQQFPPLMDALAERVAAMVVERLAPATPAETVQSPMHAASTQTLVEHLPKFAQGDETAPAPEDQPLTIGKGAGKRLTDAGRARLKELAGKGMLPGAIARELGVSRGSVVLRLGDEERPAEPAGAQAERDLARAEKLRAYQRERVRKARAAKKHPATPDAEPPPVPASKTVVVVPAAVAPAPRQPATPDIRALAAKVAQRGRAQCNPPAPMDPAQLEPVPASYEDALDWLYAHLYREGLKTAEIETRLAQATTKQIIASCNAMRVKLGLSPYVVSERAA